METVPVITESCGVNRKLGWGVDKRVGRRGRRGRGWQKGGRQKSLTFTVLTPQALEDTSMAQKADLIRVQAIHRPVNTMLF